MPACDPTKPFAVVADLFTPAFRDRVSWVSVSASEENIFYNIVQYPNAFDATFFVDRSTPAVAFDFDTAHLETIPTDRSLKGSRFWISDDGLTSYAGIGSNTRPNDRIYWFSRPSVGATWSPGTLLAGLEPNDALKVRLGEPFVAGTEIYFSRSEPSGIELLYADLTLLSPSPVLGLPSNGSSSHPVLSPDRRVIYWAFHENGLANTSIWRAERPQPTGAFTNATVVAPTVTNLSTFVPVGVSADECRLYALKDVDQVIVLRR